MKVKKRIIDCGGFKILLSVPPYLISRPKHFSILARYLDTRHFFVQRRVYTKLRSHDANIIFNIIRLIVYDNPDAIHYFVRKKITKEKATTVRVPDVPYEKQSLLWTSVIDFCNTTSPRDFVEFLLEKRLIRVIK